VRRDAPLIAAVVTQLFVLLAAGAFHLRVRPSVIDSYRRAALPLPTSVALGLSSWLLPTALLVATVLGIWAVLSNGKRGARLRALAIGLTVSGLVFVYAALVAIVPLLG
jgi:hypothetical protein